MKKNESDYGESYRKRLDRTKIPELIKLFENSFSTSEKNIELLDIGFGSGEFLFAMKEKGFKVSDSNVMLLLLKLLWIKI